MLLFSVLWGISDFCSWSYTRVSLGCQDVVILDSSSWRRCKLCLVSPSLSFLKGGSQVEEFARWSVLRSSLRSRSVVVPKDVRETQSLNQVWIKVQGRFNQYHQDIDNATRRGFKFIWIKRPQANVWRSPRRYWSKTYVLALPDPDKSFISTMMHLVKVWDVSLCKKEK